MEDKKPIEAKAQSTPSTTRRRATSTTTTRKTATSTRRSTQAAKKQPPVVKEPASVEKAPKVVNQGNNLDEAKLKAMAVSLVEAINTKEGVSLAKNIKKLDKAFKEEKKLKETIAENLEKLEKYQNKVAKLEAQIGEFEQITTSLKEQCNSLKGKIAEQKDTLATAIAEL